MKYGFSLFLCFFMFFMNSWAESLPTRRVEIVSSYTKKTEIGREVFLEREEFFNGTTKRVWGVDGKPVTQSEFEDKLLEAEREVRRQELRNEQAQRQTQATFKERSLVVGTRKILALLVQEIDRQLDKLSVGKVGKFFVFDDANFGSQEKFDHVLQELLPAARALHEKDDRVAMTELAIMVEQLEMVPKKLQNLFQKTVSHAIETCDDAKVLKELLDIVAQA
jgi:hypothetical protein